MIKIERSYPVPASLAIEAKRKSGNYEQPDVIEQLKRDFYEKCYICGMGDLQDPEVEHLLPHKNGAYPDRKFDWDNLFWSCGHCNSIKKRTEYDEMILDCCKNDPEEFLSFELDENNVTLQPIQTKLRHHQEHRRILPASHSDR